MDQLLFHLGGKAASRREMLRVGPAGWDHDGSKAPPPSDRGRRGVGGAETPTPASTRGGCSAPDWLATCPRRSWYPSFGGDSGRCILADLDVTEATMQGGRWHGKLVSGQAQIQLPTFGLPGHRQPCKGVGSTLEALWTDRFAGVARSWLSWAQCSGPSSGLPSAWW
jgi:hypothetical protein